MARVVHRGGARRDPVGRWRRAQAADARSRTRQGDRDRFGGGGIVATVAAPLAPLERVDGKPGSVVFAKDATAEVTIEPDGSGSLVTYRLRLEPGTLVNTFMLRVLAPGPIGKSFETSLERLAKLTETPT
jgi:hypothetical protein